MTSSERRWLGLGLGLALFSAAATAAVLSFGDGLFPVYRYATELAVEASRCPAPAGSEATIDYVCAEDLLAHGPLMLGARSPVLSFVFDLVALVGLAVATWRRREYFYVGRHAGRLPRSVGHPPRVERGPGVPARGHGLGNIQVSRPPGRQTP